MGMERYSFMPSNAWQSMTLLGLTLQIHVEIERSKFPTAGPNRVNFTRAVTSGGSGYLTDLERARLSQHAAVSIHHSYRNH